MQRRYALLIIAALATASAQARDLTVSQCLSLNRGIHALDCSGRHLDSPATPECKKQYRLGSLRIDLALSLYDLDRLQTTVERARNDMVRESLDKAKEKDSKVSSIPPGSPEYTQFIEAFQGVLDRKCDVPLPHIRVEQLHIGDGDNDNQIPLDVIGALAPIIDRLPPVEEKK